MKTRLLALGLGLSLFALLFSCSKENKPTEKIEINTKGLPFNSIKEINTQLLQTKFGEKKRQSREVFCLMLKFLT